MLRHDAAVDLPDSLRTLLEDGVIDDVRARLMSGKEAAVWVVERKGELIAAKVYKDREHRTFKATADYVEGRNQTRNSRDKRAMGKRTTYGRELIESSWRDMEYQALSDAFHAGVRVPEPILLYEDVLLMQLLVDDDGAPAPRLADFELPPDVATLLHREIYGQVRLLLRSGRIHGDLSAYNILIARDGPTLIDLPQVVDASLNNNAAAILQRDLQNVTEHLSRFDSRLLRFRDCGSALWEHYTRGRIDVATEPEEGTVRRADRPSFGRRAREAEQGRAGRQGPPRRDGFGGPAPADAARRDEPPRHGPRRDEPPRDGPRRDGPRRDGPPPRSGDGPRDGFRRDGPRDGTGRPGPASEGHRRDGPSLPRRDGPREGPRPEGHRQGPPRRDGPPPPFRRDSPPRRDGPPGPRREGPPSRGDRPG